MTMRFFSLLLFVLVSLYSSCRGVVKKASLVQAVAVDSQQDIHECTTVLDTTFKNGNLIAYVPLGHGVYGAVFTLGNLIDTLNEKFDCQTPNGLIPKVLIQDSNMIIFCQGVGMHFRNLIVCRKVNPSTILKEEFETTISLNCRNDFFVYCLEGNLYSYNRDTGELMKRGVIPKHDTISKSIVFDYSIEVYLKSGRIIKFPVELSQRGLSR